MADSRVREAAGAITVPQAHDTHVVAPTRCDSPDLTFTADGEAHPLTLSDGSYTITDAREPSLRPEGNECMECRQRVAAAVPQRSTYAVLIEACTQGAILHRLNAEVRQQVTHKHEALSGEATLRVLASRLQHRVGRASQSDVLAAIIRRKPGLARCWVEAERHR